jgi:endoglucanase
MLKWLRRLFDIAGPIAGAMIFIAADAPNARASCVETMRGVAPARMHALSRGFNLAGQLDDVTAPLMHPDLLRTLRASGMTHIRLPVPAETIMAAFSGEAVIARQLRHVEQILNELVALGYSVTLDMHPGEPFRKLHRQNAAEAMGALKQAWNSLAPLIRRFSSQRVFAELLNEPDIDATRWQAELEELAAYVRERLPGTTLIVGPVNWQRADSLPGLQPLDDLNVVYAIHFYDPMVFTHQGHWNKDDPLSSIKGLPFPIRRNAAAVRELRARLLAERKEQAIRELDVAVAASAAGDIIAHRLQPAVEWQRRHRRPLIVNEFGVLKHQAPKASRIAWIRSVARFAEANCWGWTHWELAQGFGLLDERQALDKDVIRALLPR